MHDELRGLIAAHPLPPGFSEPQLFTDTVDVGDARVRRAGIQSSTASGLEVTGSAAELVGSPIPRAYFELLERAALIDAAERPSPVRDASGRQVGARAPDFGESAGDPRSRRARSNGVALHRSWAEACRRARFELAERDRVLGSWYGELALVPAETPASLRALESTHTWLARLVRAAHDDADADVEVAIVVGFPRSPELPLARGFAGRGSRSEAIEAAAAEAWQSLAFVWGEPLPAAPPSLAPTPLFHLDYYLWPPHHASLRAWLDASAIATVESRDRGADATCYVDLTPSSFRPSLHVARAVRRSARELIFGEAPAHLRARLPLARHVHPIP